MSGDYRNHWLEVGVGQEFVGLLYHIVPVCLFEQYVTRVSLYHRSSLSVSCPLCRLGLLQLNCKKACGGGRGCCPGF